jgi:dihydrofolate reductase
MISMIAAIGKNRALGLNNQLLWDIPEDIKHFRETTKGHPVIMGRKTFESIGRPLPNRTNIIISRNTGYQQEGCITCTSLENAITEAKKQNSNEIFIIGGAQIYEQGMKLADKLYLTIVDDEPEADAFFPEYSAFSKVLSKKCMDNDKYRFCFLELGK